MPRILVVEDTPANQLLATSVLEREGFEVVVAESVHDAEIEIARHRPDLILTDIQLPGMDGLSFTRRLKADPSTASITVVAMTAHAMVGDREKAIAAGCAGYIPKPIDTRALGEQVRGFLLTGTAEAAT